jgi:hypothetical protein
MSDNDNNAMKPSEQRTAERRQQKQEGRSRRADLLLDQQVKEKGRQDALEDRQQKIEKRLGDVEARLDAYEARLQPVEAFINS